MSKTKKNISYWQQNHTILPPYYIPEKKLKELWKQNARFIHAFGVTITLYAKIGKNVTFFNNVNLAINHDKGPTIGDNCVFFPKCSIIGDITLGNNCIVGNSAVVTKSFPPYSLIAGNPARLIRTMTPEEYLQEMNFYNDSPSWRENLKRNKCLQKDFEHILGKDFTRMNQASAKYQMYRILSHLTFGTIHQKMKQKKSRYKNTLKGMD